MRLEWSKVVLYWREKWTDFTSFFSDGWRDLAAGAQVVWNNFTSWFVPLFADAWDRISGLFTDGWRSLVASVRVLWVNFSSWLAGLIATVVNPIIEGAADVLEGLEFDTRAAKLREGKMLEGGDRDAEREKKIGEIMGEAAAEGAKAREEREKRIADRHARVEAERLKDEREIIRLRALEAKRLREERDEGLAPARGAVAEMEKAFRDAVEKAKGPAPLEVAPPPREAGAAQAAAQAAQAALGLAAMMGGAAPDPGKLFKEIKGSFAVPVARQQFGFGTKLDPEANEAAQLKEQQRIRMQQAQQLEQEKAIAAATAATRVSSQDAVEAFRELADAFKLR